MIYPLDMVISIVMLVYERVSFWQSTIVNKSATNLVLVGHVQGLSIAVSHCQIVNGAVVSLPAIGVNVLLCPY